MEGNNMSEVYTEDFDFDSKIAMMIGADDDVCEDCDTE